MSKYDRVELTGNDQQVLKVLRHDASRLERAEQQQERTDQRLGDAVSSTEALLKKLGRPLPAMPVHGSAIDSTRRELSLSSWSEIVKEAETSISGPIGLADILSQDDIARVESRIALLREEVNREHRLDAIDWTIAGVAGTLAALVDAFLIRCPRSPGFLGSKPTEGGPLSNFIRDRLKVSLSPEQVRNLEQEFPVPYDASTSRNLQIPVSGLCPRTHRFQSLGHDPLLGFLFGTIDILLGTMTAIDKNGHLIHQATQAAPLGMNLFEALGRQLGHLASDISTPAGLPAPMMPLLQLIRVGKPGRTVGDIARLMYAKGYDFGHFLAMSVSPLLIEVLVRVSYGVKRLIEGHELMACIPMSLPGRPSPPKLQTMLFTAHLIATAANAGRVCLGPAFNPLAINYPQWVAFFKYTWGQIKWGLWEKENLRIKHAQSKIDAGWEELNRDLTECWTFAEVPKDIMVLSPDH